MVSPPTPAAPKGPCWEWGGAHGGGSAPQSDVTSGAAHGLLAALTRSETLDCDEAVHLPRGRVLGAKSQRWPWRRPCWEGDQLYPCAFCSWRVPSPSPAPSPCTCCSFPLGHPSLLFPSKALCIRGWGGCLAGGLSPVPRDCGVRGTGDLLRSRFPPPPPRPSAPFMEEEHAWCQGCCPQLGPHCPRPLPPPPVTLGGPQESLWGEGKGLPWGEFLLEALRGSGASGAGRSLVWTVGRGGDNGAWRAELQERN